MQMEANDTHFCLPPAIFQESVSAAIWIPLSAH